MNTTSDWQIDDSLLIHSEGKETLRLVWSWPRVVFFLNLHEFYLLLIDENEKLLANRTEGYGGRSKNKTKTNGGCGHVPFFSKRGVPAKICCARVDGGFQPAWLLLDSLLVSDLVTAELILVRQ